MSGEFKFSPATAKKAADCLFVCKKTLGELQAKMEDCILGARSAWQCDSADAYLRQAGDMVKQAALPQTFVNSANDMIVGAIQNYESAEAKNRESTESITKAFT